MVYEKKRSKEWNGHKNEIVASRMKKARRRESTETTIDIAELVEFQVNSTAATDAILLARVLHINKAMIDRLV